MATTNLYDTLGVARNATPEEIRKAYRRKALETHPDRLSPNASPAEKAASEELFRKVNNAYEVLRDPQNRASYDKHGAWPPPTPGPQGPFSNGPHQDPFANAFFREPYGFGRAPRTTSMPDPFGGGFGFRPHASPRGVFTDPFELFNSIFGDFGRAFEVDPFFDEQPFGRRGVAPNVFGGGPFSGGFPSLFDASGSRGMHGTRNGGTGPRWVSQSWTSSSVNGVTHTKSVRMDSEGNEHVTYRYPDGTERRTINGVEQSAPAPRALPSSASYPTEGVTMSMPMPMAPPPPYSEAMGQPSQHRRSRSSRQHGYTGDRHEHRDGRGYRDEGQRYWRS